jgi:hypothetical protein
MAYCGSCLKDSEKDLSLVMADFSQIYELPFEIRALVLHGMELQRFREVFND